MIATRHTPTGNIAESELANAAAMLARGIDAVILFVSDGGFARLTQGDLPAIRAFLDGHTDTLSLPGGLLPDEAVNV